MNCKEKVSSNLGLANAFNQIEMREEDVKKAAVTTVRLFEYSYMPYGLGRALQILQKLIVVVDCA